MIPRPRRRLLGVVIGVALALALQETLFRGVFPVAAVTNFDRIHYSPLRTDLSRELTAANSLAHASYRWGSEPDGTKFCSASPKASPFG